MLKLVYKMSFFYKINDIVIVDDLKQISQREKMKYGLLVSDSSKLGHSTSIMLLCIGLW